MKDVGIVGLPQSGKTTLFNALTRAGAPAGGAAGKASVAAVPVPDPRVGVLAELERSRKKGFVQARFVDVAGLSAAQGPGGSSLAPRYLGALREADALAMVLAAFGGSGPDPVEAAAELTLELTVADLESIAGGAEKAAKKARAGVKDAALEAEVLARARDLLDQGTPLRTAHWEPEEAQVLKNFAPLTLKPALAVLNLAEDEAAVRIHSDLRQGVILAEVIGDDELVAAGGWDAARSKGRLRTESRSYVVREGDVLHIRFNV